MTEPWTATRIAERLHRRILAPLGFQRSGTTCARTDHQLIRTITFYALRATSPRVQLRLSVALDGLPDPLGPYRRDALWGYPQPIHGRNWYPRPPRQDPLPDQLITDVAGPAVEFLLYANGLVDFISWAQEIYGGDPHRGWWRRFQPVMPQGTSPLQAAAYAAALMNDQATTEQLAAQVVADERSRDELARFQAELRHACTT